MSFNYEERIVAFIDIIAFENLVTRLENNDALHHKLRRALMTIRLRQRFAGDKNSAHEHLEVSVFSDTIALSVAPEHITDLFWSCLILQAELLEIGVLVRGGISFGKTVHQQDIMYGEGIIRAYRLESRSAIYPRVVVEPDLMLRIESGITTMFLSQDTDGLWFIDPFADGLSVANPTEHIAEGFDPWSMAYDTLNREIESELAATQQANHIMKWKWTQGKLLEAMSFLKTFGLPRIHAIIKRTEGELQRRKSGNHGEQA